MTIKESLDRISPTEQEKQRLYMRIKSDYNLTVESSYKKAFIRYGSVAVLALMLGAAAITVHLVAAGSGGKPIEVSFGNSYGVISQENSSVPKDADSNDSEFISSDASAASSADSVYSETEPPASETTTETTTEATTPASSESTQTEIKSDPTSAEATPAPVGTAENVTLVMNGSDALLNHGLMFCIKIDESVVNGDSVFSVCDRDISTLPYFSTNGPEYTFDSLDYGYYILTAPVLDPTCDGGYPLFKIDENSSNSRIEVDLNKADIAPEKVNVYSENVNSDIEAEAQQAVESNGYTYLFADMDKGWKEHIVPGSAYSYSSGEYQYRLYEIKTEDEYYSATTLCINGKVLSAKDIKKYCLIKGVFNRDTTKYALMIREDLSKNGKFDIIYGERFDIQTLDNTIDMTIKDDKGKIVKNCDIHFRHIDNVSEYKYLHTGAQLQAGIYVTDAKTDSNGKVILDTSLFVGRCRLEVDDPDKKYTFNYDYIYEFTYGSSEAVLKYKIPLENE